MSDQTDLFAKVAETKAAETEVDTTTTDSSNTPQTSPQAIIPQNLPQDWQQALITEFSAPYFHTLRDFLVEERSQHTIYPPAPDVFNALRYTPLEQVKVFILGQDPYHGPNQAHGLSFSVRPGVRIPPSLRNIYKELQSDLGVTPSKHGHLKHWSDQGILLLNAVLTVRQGQATSHANKGWEKLTDAIIQVVNAKEQRVVFILWGGYARKKKRLITGKQHIIIESGHPSPLSERYFFGTQPFSKTNAALEEAGLSAIDWQLPNEDT